MSHDEGLAYLLLVVALSRPGLPTFADDAWPVSVHIVATKLFPVWRKRLFRRASRQTFSIATVWMVLVLAALSGKTGALIAGLSCW